ncbi:MAG: D-alanine--D-alanine ligase, partial [Kangiellaceae bacterium]|nr:D-alanine--D-alanine ligase [Kangiellaceae bacterium]
FTGRGSSGSAISMNKIMSKLIWRQAGFDTADFLQLSSSAEFVLGDAEKVIETLGKVLFVKPANEGSSVGMSKSTNAEELVIAVTKAQKFGTILIEQFVDGREYTVGIVNGEALPSISMVPPNEYYDYEAKYLADTTKYFCPSGLSEDEEQQLKLTALAAFETLGCSGWGRVDFIRDKSSDVVKLLEANTIPGMTKTSLLPKAARATGMNFSELVINILSTSLAVGEECYG